MAANPFFYTSRAVRKILPFGKLSRSQQHREINAYRRANPDKSERQARKSLSDARRNGRLPQYGTNGNDEQIAHSIVYQDRSARAHEAFEHRGKPIKAIVKNRQKGSLTTVVEDVYGTTKTERRNIARHWNYVKAYLNRGGDVDYFEDRMKRFDGKRAGIVGSDRLRLETDPGGIDILAILGLLDFESIYEESGFWSDAA